MGCDIHLHAEIKLNGVWEHYSLIRVERDYSLFTFLSGVRGPGEGIAKRGMPEGITKITMYDYQYWLEDLHNDGWIGIEGIKLLEDRYIKTCRGRLKEFYEDLGYMFGNRWGNFEGREEVSDVRFVFWYDN